MINSKPNQPNKYKQGLYIPKNKDKVLKLNTHGGLYFRSSLEKKLMIWLDNYQNIKRWACEVIKVDYNKTEWNSDKKSLETTKHTYYPDFYYELIKKDGSVSKIVCEVKPYSETIPPVMKENASISQLRNFEYSLKMWNKNISKWQTLLEFCKNKGYEFVIITEKNLK